ncbi:alpha/beta fold hydrolase [Candidatus Zixiibacteriota bacterium]
MALSKLLRSHLMMLMFISLTVIFLSCQKQSDTPSLEGSGVVNSADDVPIHYQVAGTGRPALVFVHCWCCDQSFWDAQVPYFSEKHTVVTIDLAGHGESPADRETWTIPAFGLDVVAVVEKLDLKQVVLIGHSMGGPVSLEATRHMPERVIGLVGVDNFQDMGQQWHQEDFETFLGTLKADFQGTTRNFVGSMFPPAADSALVERVLADLASAPAEVGIGAMEAYYKWFRDDFERVVAEIDVPLHCISADLWPTNVEGNRKYFPSFDISVMPGRGHFLHMEDPETFNRLLEEVVAKFTSASSD